MLKKTNQNEEHKSTNLWLGFALGSISVGLLAYFFGTKKGRETLKKLLYLSENLEENLEIITANLEEFISEKSEKIKEGFEKEVYKEKPALENLLDKMKTLVPHAKEQKKFFIKEKN